ncbi:FHA domain-containing protein [Embleya sp. NPDC005971]|uniref:FHA domain-containing protein n=1 Tax=Embleya sp. NPDC005971 TaxID=3156724 RepID=UPI0033D886E3
MDVANVCHSEELYPIGEKGPFLARLDAVVDAWRARHGADVRIELVADKALLHALDATDRRDLRRRVADGEVTLRPVADTLVLERAEADGLHVLSGDFFLDFRRRHPWIPAHPERFHHWHQDARGVRFVLRGIGAERERGRGDFEDGAGAGHRGGEATGFRGREVAGGDEVTAGGEFAGLRDEHFDPGEHPGIANTRWRCEEPLCVYARMWTGRLPVWPRVDARAGAVCPECASPLRALGPRRPTRQVELADHATGEPIERLPLELGSNLVLGRGRIANGYDLGSRQDRFGEAVRYVSRQHVLLRFAEGRAGEHVFAVDLGSSNGTEIERWNGSTHEPGRPLDADTEELLAPHDRLVLGGGVRVELPQHHLDPTNEPPR